MNALIFCEDEALEGEIDSALTRIGYEVENWRRPGTLAARAIQARPDLLVLFAARAGRWIGAAVAEVHQSSPGTKIIYATRNPGEQDAEILEQGVFYYAGNAPIEEIVASAKAASSAAAGEGIDEYRYQLRLRPGETLGEVLDLLLARTVAGLKKVPGWGPIDPTAAAALEKELRRVLDHYVTTYDLCGIKAGCFEAADPAGWSPSPDPAVAEPHDWEEVRILQLEIKRGLSEFSDALEAAALRTLCRDPGRAQTARTARKALTEAVQGVVGPRLFRALAGDCDLCKDVKRIDPWSIGVR